MNTRDMLANVSFILNRKRLGLSGATLFFALLLFLGVVRGSEQADQRGIGGIALSGVGSYRNSWAVVIGINRYIKVPYLNYAVNDAKSVAASLQKLGFPSDKVIVLLDRQATRQRIEQVFYETLFEATPEDRVFVFFAGHGVTASLPRGGEEGYLLPVDGDPKNLPLTAISMEDVRKIARRIPAKHFLFVVDACYSGFAITRDVPPTKVDSMYLEAVTKEPAVQIITAGRKGEQVLEEEGHGLFTRRLLSGLMTGLADTDQNGIITAQELATWLESRVVRDSQNRQHPQYSRLDGEGQFVFVVSRKQDAPVVAAPREQEKLKEEVRRLAEEAEQLKRERALFEEQRKLQAERDALLAEKRKLEEEKQKAESPRQELPRQELPKHEIQPKASALTPGMIIKHVQIGKTTQTEIMEIFGPPDMITKSGRGEMWGYDKVSREVAEGAVGAKVESRSGATGSMGAGGSQQTSDQRRRTETSTSVFLLIYFDEKGAVTDYRLSATKF